MFPQVLKTRPLGRVFFHWPPALAFAALFFLALWILRPGLGGGFLFDDEPNLSALGAHGGVVDWATFKAYVSGGIAGPTGRPLALVSFLIDDNTWPSHPGAFKRTNLALHLLNFTALVWATLLLARLHGWEERRAAWLAVLAAGAWALHPFLVSTTFYVVQRMALLAATFSFLALVGYLHGRLLFPHRPRQGMLWMGASLTLGTLAATLSKENGVLLPLLVGVIEYTLPMHPPRVPWLFKALFIWIPSLAVLGYLLAQWNPAPNPWPNRSFNQMERLLTEARILWDYLGWWFWPRVEGSGLFRDAIPISRSLTEPPTTLLAVMGILALPVIAIILRRKAPFLSLAILFFLAGHLLESSLIGLELYFEHRNYLPTAFLLLPLAASVLQIESKERRHLGVFAGAVALSVLAFLTHQRAELWGDPVKLESYWALAAPESPRGANALARHLIDHAGDIASAEKVLDKALALHPNNGLLVLSRLQLDINLRRARYEDFEKAARRLENAPFDAQAVMALRHVTDSVLKPSAPESYADYMRILIDALAINAYYRDLPLFTRLLPYLRARLVLKKGDASLAESFYLEAMHRYNNIGSAMQMVAEMASSGHPVHALRLLDAAQSILERQPERSLTFDRTAYFEEIHRIRQFLEEDRAKLKSPTEG